MKKVALLVLFFASPALADSVNFDTVAAPIFYQYVTPNTGLGPFLTFPGVSFSGGVILSNGGWRDLATTAPNLYATSDYSILADGSSLPGTITINFTSPVSSVSLDVINGFYAAHFFMNVFDSNELIGSASIFLEDFYGPGGAVGTLSFNGPGITRITIDSGQDPGIIDFAIDSVNFSTETPTAATPEPGSLLLLGSGVVCLGGYVRMRIHKHSLSATKVS